MLKADNGERSGKFAVIWEMSTVEQRDRYVPEQGQITAEGRRLLGPDFDK